MDALEYGPEESVMFNGKAPKTLCHDEILQPEFVYQQFFAVVAVLKHRTVYQPQ